MAEMARNGPGRPRILPSLALWAGLLVCVLKGFSSKLDLWRLLSQHFLWSYPRFALSDQAVYGFVFSEGRYDIGKKLDYLRATVELAMDREDLGPEFRAFLTEVVQKRGLV